MNALKQKLARGERAVLVNLGFNSPNLVEYLATLGFEAVMLDCEHTSASVERVEEMARAARAGGIAAIVRPEKLDEALVTRYLECKIAGLMIPHVHDAAGARSIVEMVRYAQPASHHDLLLIAMLESKEAIDNLDSILEVPGIDVFFIARVDLSKSLGYGGDKQHPALREAVDSMIDRIRAAGRVVGAAGDYEAVQDVAAKGVQLLFVGTKGLLQPGAASYRQRAGLG